MDPKRLLDGAASPLALRLLEAGAEEKPSPEAMERALCSTLLAVGIGVTLKSGPVAALASHTATGAATTAAGTSGAGSAAVAGAGLATAKATSTVAVLHTATGAGTSAVTVLSGAGTSAVAVVSGAGAPLGAGLATSAAGAAGAAASSLEAGLTLAVIAKWVGVGAVGIATATGAPELLQWLEGAPVAEAARAVAGDRLEAAPSPRGTPPRVRQPKVDPLRSPEPAPVAPPATTPMHAPAPARDAARISTPPEPGRATSTPATPPAPPRRAARAIQAARASGSAEASAAPPSSLPSTLRAEMASIELARSLLDGGDPRAALREVERYERETGRPQLRAEARVLRMEALSRSGEWQRARALARELLSDGVAPPHAARARALLEEEKATP